MHNLLELNDAYNRTAKEQQTCFKDTLNRSTNDNLHMDDRIKLLLLKLEKHHQT